MTVNERIKAVRKSLNLSQEEFGSKLGIKKSAVSKLENGINNPTDSIFKLICSTYGVYYLWLTEEKGNMMVNEDEVDTDAMVERVMAGESELAISIMKAFMKMPDQEWIKFRDMMDKIKNEGLS